MRRESERWKADLLFAATARSDPLEVSRQWIYEEGEEAVVSPPPSCSVNVDGREIEKEREGKEGEVDTKERLR